MRVDLKNNLIQYILLELYTWYKEFSETNNNDLSILKSLKLFFLLSTVNLDKEDNLLKKGFNNYYAMPFGPVEDDVYEFFKESNFINKKTLKVDLLEIDYECEGFNEYKSIVNSCIEELKRLNSEVITYSASKLVDLTHKYSSWITNYNIALKENCYKRRIPIEEIIKEEKFYFI